MSIIWSGVTEEGAVVPVQVDETGKVIATAAVPGGDYVKKSGDNMSGNLTLGTDKLELKADDGSAEFAGDVSIGGTLPSSPNVKLLAEGKVAVNRASSSQIMDLGSNGLVSYVFTSHEFNNPYSNAGLHIGTNLRNIPADSNTFLCVDGSATFSSSVAVSRLFAGPAATGQSGLQIYQPFNGDKVVCNIFGDGSASFAGDKCGVTSAGEFFFTSRNERFRLVVQGELVVAEPYTRELELKEKAEQFIADKRETKPSDPQGEVTMDIDNSSLNQD